MEYRVLGPLEAVEPDGGDIALGGLKQRAVLACLLVNHNQAVSADRLIDAIWGAETPADPKAALQTYVSRLRRVLGHESIGARGSGYLLRVGPDDVDSLVFERLVQEAGSASDRRDHAAAIERYDQALEVWHGDAYGDFIYADFARGESERLEEVRRGAIEDRLSVLLDSGRHREALPDLEQALADEPLRERLWALYMVALYRAGRQADALRAYSRAAEVLAEELGIEPSAELKDVEERVLLQSADLDWHGESTEESRLEGEVAVLVAASHGGNDARAAWDYFDSAAERNAGQVANLAAGRRMAVFEHVAGAASAAIELQALGLAETEQLSYGIHYTELHIRRGEYVGIGVSRASRVANASAPCQILMTEAAADRYPDAREALHVAVDIDMPGMSNSETVYLVQHTHEALADVATSPPHRTNLATGGLTSFIGRAGDIHDVRALTAEHRLVTLTGPGGVGKTRLAFQVAADLVGGFAGGVWVIELASLSDELIASQLLTTLGLEAFPGETTAEAIARLAAVSGVFLVMDNCEHVIDAVADVVASLLRLSDRVSILATSRERLGVPGEYVYQVPGLATPSRDQSTDVSTLAKTDSVRLFVARAQAVRSDYQLAETDAAAVATLCTRLDGIPLAIELAASRLDALTPAEVVARLDDRFRLLVTRSRAIPPRQQTLEAVVGWSHDLLNDDERVLVRRLAIFDGTFDLTAAEAVCSGPDLAESAVLDLIAALVSKNLVTAKAVGGATRYGMLETIHAYTARLLIESGDRAEIASRHADHYSRLAHLWAKNEPPVVNEWWHQLIAQPDNVRAALEFIALHRPAPELHEMVADLQWFWVFRSMTEYGLMWSRRVLEPGGASGEVRVKLARGAGPLAAEEQRFDEADRWIREALDYWEAQDNPFEAASDINNLSVLARLQGRLPEALELATRSMELFRASRNDSYLPSHKLSGIVTNRAEILCDLGRLDDAHADSLTALSDASNLASEDAYLYYDAVRVMGRVMVALGRLDEASIWFSKASEAGDDLGSDFKGRAYNGLATVAIIRNDLDEAESFLKQAIATLEERAFDRLESTRLMSLTMLLRERPGNATVLARETVARAAGGAGDRNLSAALEIAGICDVIGGDRELGWTLMESGRTSLRTAGIVHPAWHESVISSIGELYGVDLDSQPHDIHVSPLGTSDAGRLVLTPR